MLSPDKSGEQLKLLINVDVIMFTKPFFLCIILGIAALWFKYNMQK